MVDKTKSNLNSTQVAVVVEVGVAKDIIRNIRPQGNMENTMKYFKNGFS